MSRKLLMSCDDYVYHHNGIYYAASQEKADFYKRYLRVFDRLKLATRCVDEENLKSSRVPLDAHIEFVPIPFFRGPFQYLKKYRKIKQVLSAVVDDCDAAILRLPATVAMHIYKHVSKKGIPYATEIVYDAYDGYVSSTKLLHKILWKRIDRNMRQVCYNADGVSCVTEHYLQQRYYTKRKDGFSSHYSSLALPKSFYTAARKYPAKDCLSIVHVANQVGGDGRKGHKELIEAIAKLKEQSINVDVCFVGEDYLGGVETLKKLATQLGVMKQVNFLGYLNRAQLAQSLEEADIFVLPTKAEGLPRVIIEAMAKGLPCISTNVSGNPELLNSYFLLDYTDVDLLAARIKELVQSPTLYETTSKENYENSLKYEASILEKRRDAFYTKLKQRVDAQ